MATSGWERGRTLMRISLAFLLSLLPATAGADWLVLTTGERVETKGHWKVKGKQIVYTALDQSLLSVRLSEVDLEASTRASAQEPPSKKETYRDLGVDQDMASYKAAKEFSRLNAWITNPNAPRGTGSVSVPGLRISESDLAREGAKILEDPQAVESELLRSAAQIDAEYSRCLEANSAKGDPNPCVEAFVHDAEELRQKAAEVYAAVDAARRLEADERQIEDESGAETQRIQNEGAAEAAEPADPPRR